MNNKEIKDRTGEEKINSQGLKMKIIRYKNAKDITVQFEDGFTRDCRYNQFKVGTINNLNYPNANYKKDRIGLKNINNQGLEMTILEYNNSENILVEFEDGFRLKTTFFQFQKGKILNPNHPKIYKGHEVKMIGMKRINNQGLEMEIIDYKNPNDFLVRFEDGTIQKGTFITNFKKGCLYNPNVPTVYGKGFNSKKSKANKNTRVWTGMIRRCFSDEQSTKFPAYINCTVCDEWLNFAEFEKWLISQPNYEKWLNTSGWALDKDILHKGNKEYSPDKCCLVPQSLNCLISKDGKKKDNDLPIGVFKRYNKNSIVYGISIKDKNGKLINKSKFKTIKEAFAEYKKIKEEVIQDKAQKEYEKENITKECYEALMNWKVEMTDYK